MPALALVGLLGLLGRVSASARERGSPGGSWGGRARGLAGGGPVGGAGGRGPVASGAAAPPALQERSPLTAWRERGAAVRRQSACAKLTLKTTRNVRVRAPKTSECVRRSTQKGCVWIGVYGVP